ncbi:MAG: hypothetical protein ACRDOF_11295 [Gaiellaceae bacterium]
MHPWLSLTIIVLVAVALFADHRRSSADARSGRSWFDDISRAPIDELLRPNVRDGRYNGHVGSVPRPLAARRGATGVRKLR